MRIRFLARLQQLFEIRRDERARTALVFLYLLFVLSAHYVLKPSSRALFLTRFNKDHLPYLYLVIAVTGGLMASVYARAASRWSLRTALEGSIGISIGCLVLLWQLLSLDAPWVYYVFNVWVSLFGVVLVSQGWLLASNVFNPREAKRIYPLLGVGAVMGAAIGGSFTSQLATLLGTRNLVLVSSAFVALAFAAYRALLRAPGVNLAGARAETALEEGFSPVEILSSILRVTHLRVIVGLLLATYVVDTLIDYQFNAIAVQGRQGDDLTAFLGGFYGIWLNLATFVLQLFVTSLVVNLTGVGGTLLIIPTALAAASAFMLVSPGMLAAGIARLIEAAMRYSFNRTGMELLYLPLPDELRQKTKTFVDVFVDRGARGLAALMLLAFGWIFKDNLAAVTWLVLVICLAWAGLAIFARREYIATVRKRLESRRLDIESMRIPYQDPGLLQMLAEASRSENARAAGYAISLLDEVPNYPLDAIALRLIDKAPPEVRAQLFEIAVRRQWSTLLPAARRELTMGVTQALSAALRYLSLCGDGPERGHIPVLLKSSDLRLVEAAVMAATFPDQLPLTWVREAVRSENPIMRRIGALAVSFYPEEAASMLIPLLSDRDASVRRTAQDVLAGHSGYTSPALAAIIANPDQPLRLRLAAMRTLGRSASPEAVNALRTMMTSHDLAIRSAAVRALTHIHDKGLDDRFALDDVSAGIRLEAREYFWLHIALASLRTSQDQSRALNLLLRTIEERMTRNVERVFRLLGLRYPPKDIDVAWKAFRRKQPNQVAHAMEFLDNILDYDVKRFVLPLLDNDAVDRQALLLFGIEPLSAEAALRLLIREGDPWLTACATAVAGDLRLREAEPEIKVVLETRGPLLHAVARQALARMAPGEAS